MSHHYENWLRKAAFAEKNGRLKYAVSCLEKAATHTGDQEERFHLKVWTDRLREAVAASEGEGET